MEAGNGGERCDYLRERGIETYLVVLPKGPAGKSGINGVVSLSGPSRTHGITHQATVSNHMTNRVLLDLQCSLLMLNPRFQFLIFKGFLLSTFQKLSVTSSNGNSPQLINTTECNGSINTACTTPEEPEELDTRVTHTHTSAQPHPLINLPHCSTGDCRNIEIV